MSIQIPLKMTISATEPTPSSTTSSTRSALQPWEERLLGTQPRVWLRLVSALLQYGNPLLKAALVGATYFFEKGVFFGGRELQPSHAKLREWFRGYEAGGTQSTGRKWHRFSEIPCGDVAWIDVHTGLGPCGVDVLLGASEDEETLSGIFGRSGVAGVFDGVQALGKLDTDLVIERRCGRAEIPAGRAVSQSKSQESRGSAGHSEPSQAGPQAAGYELSIGFLARDEWLRQFFQCEAGGADASGSHGSDRVFALTQEFGTVSNVSVARAMLIENQAWFWELELERRQYWRRYTRDAFYVRTEDWKTRVLERGFDVAGKMGNWIGDRSRL